MAWCNKEWGIPLVGATPWLPYPDSYGNSHGQRMSGSQYNNFKGILGHQHVAENDHGDPGKLNINKILSYATGPKPAEEDPDMKAKDPVVLSGSAKQFLEDRGADVGSDNALEFQWFVQWQYIETVQTNEAIVKAMEQQAKAMDRLAVAIENLGKG